MRGLSRRGRRGSARATGSHIVREIVPSRGIVPRVREARRAGTTVPGGASFRPETAGLSARRDRFGHGHSGRPHDGLAVAGATAHERAALRARLAGPSLCGPSGDFGETWGPYGAVDGATSGQFPSDTPARHAGRSRRRLESFGDRLSGSPERGLGPLAVPRQPGLGTTRLPGVSDVSAGADSCRTRDRSQRTVWSFAAASNIQDRPGYSKELSQSVWAPVSGTC